MNPQKESSRLFSSWLICRVFSMFGVPIWSRASILSTSFTDSVFYRIPFKVVKCDVKYFTSHPFGLELLRQYLQPHSHLSFSHYLNLMHWSGASALAAGQGERFVLSAISFVLESVQCSLYFNGRPGRLVLGHPFFICTLMSKNSRNSKNLFRDRISYYFWYYCYYCYSNQEYQFIF